MHAADDSGGARCEQLDAGDARTAMGSPVFREQKKARSRGPGYAILAIEVR